MAGFVLGALLWSGAVPGYFMAKKRAAAPASGYFETVEPGGGGGGGSEDVVGRLAPDRLSALLVTPAEAASIDRKVIRTAELDLIVSNVNQAADSIRGIVQRYGGLIDKAAFEETSDRQRSGSMVVRVPVERLDQALAELKKLAVRVRHENVADQDVTREYIDKDARLRNMRAEEEQYLSILKRASSIKDTLDATEKIQEVRGEIEQLQGELNYLQSQVEMSTITLALHPEEQMRVLGIEWRPLVNARIAAHEMLGGMGEWVDSIVAFFIKLPLIVLWVVTVLIAINIVWRLVRRVWRLVLPGLRPPARPAPPPSPAA